MKYFYEEKDKIELLNYIKLNSFMTGSSVYSDVTPKDYDIVVLESYLRNYDDSQTFRHIATKLSTINNSYYINNNKKFLAFNITDKLFLDNKIFNIIIVKYINDYENWKFTTNVLKSIYELEILDEKLKYKPNRVSLFECIFNLNKYS